MSKSYLKYATTSQYWQRAWMPRDDKANPVYMALAMKRNNKHIGKLSLFDNRVINKLATIRGQKLIFSNENKSIDPRVVCLTLKLVAK